MDEILNKLLESEVLSEETRATLTEQFNTAVAAYLAEERIKLEATLTEEFVKAHAELTESVNVKVDEMIAAEFNELKGDIENFRDLEVEAAEKEVALREELAGTLQTELGKLVDSLDEFLELQVAHEFNELKEDIAEAKRNLLGQQMFEAYEGLVKTHRKSDLADVEQELAEANDKLADAEKRIAESERGKLAEARTSKMEAILTPLTGLARDQMKIILSNVATARLDEAYAVYLPRILKEAAAPLVTDADKTPLVESIAPAKVVTGNDADDELSAPAATPSNGLTRMRQLAGLA